MAAASDKHIPIPESVRGEAPRYLEMLTDAALIEAARPENIGLEIALLRTWLYDTLREQGSDGNIALQLFDRIVKAAAVRYKLSPRRAADVGAAIAVIADSITDIFEKDVEV